MYALAAAPRAPDLVRWRGRAVSRVEQLLAPRPALWRELDELRTAASTALSEALGVPVRCGARLCGVQRASAHSHTAVPARCLLHLEGPGVGAVLELELSFVVDLVARMVGAPRLGIPVLTLSRFERAVLGHLVLVVLAGLRSQAAAEARWRPRLVGIVSAQRGVETGLAGQRSVSVELDLQVGEQVGRARLLVPEPAARSLILGFDEEAPPDARTAAATRIAFRQRIRCGVLWPGELQAIVPGAAVLLPEMRLEGGHLHGPLQLVRRGVLLDGQLTEPGWARGAIETRTHTTEVTCVDPQLSALPVELEVELASVPLSLAELSALAPGSIVPLRISMGDPVFLRVGDRRIARAELVDLEGEVAARVLDLLE